jgi:hypothetical protein
MLCLVGLISSDAELAHHAQSARIAYTCKPEG